MDRSSGYDISNPHVQDDEKHRLPPMDSTATIQGFIILSIETHKIIDVPIIPISSYKRGLNHQFMTTSQWQVICYPSFPGPRNVD
jgi:CRISPR/Cas system CMR subunit Cmr6 (Cas7 group RAMP superfamily)